MASIILISFREIDIKNGLTYGGIDAPAYKMIYDAANISYLDSLLIQFYEPGYGTVVWFFSSYIGGYEIFQFFIYLFLYTSLLFFLKQFKPSNLLFISIFLLSFSIVSSLNTLRIVIAIYIGFYVFYYLNKDKYLNATIIGILSLTIHTSSIILLIIIFFYYCYNNLSRLNYLLLFSSFLLLLFIGAFYILPSLLDSTRLGAYNVNEGEFSLNTFLIAALVIFMSFNRYKDFIFYNKINAVLIPVLPTIFFVLPLFYAYPIAYRFLLFYLPIIFLLIPSLLYIYRPNLKRNVKYIPMYFILLSYIIIKTYIFFTIEINSAKIYELSYLRGVF